MNVILNGLVRTLIPVQYPYGGAVGAGIGAGAGLAAGVAGFFIFFTIVVFIIAIGIWIFFIYGFYKIVIKAGYPSDKALLYTLLFTFIPIVNIYLFYLFAYKAEWPIFQQIGILKGEKPYYQPGATSGSEVKITQNRAYTPSSRQDIPPVSPVNSSKQASGMIKCPNCGAEVKEGTRFCGKCGNEIIASKQEKQNKICSDCGSKNDSDAKFCENCGKPL